MSDRKVIILGQVFDYEEKAPFVTSGVSVRGAIEYDESTDSLRCHECGMWFISLARHILPSHNISTKQYRMRHGLRMCKTSLYGPRLKSLFSAAAKQKCLWIGRSKAGIEAKRTVPKRRPASLAEKANFDGRCQAQYLFKIRALAFQLGHTPTRLELQAAKVDSFGLEKAFGSVATAMKLAGLEPNLNGGHAIDVRIRPLPPGFEPDSDRMPWPADYFGVRIFERSEKDTPQTLDNALARFSSP